MCRRPEPAVFGPSLSHDLGDRHSCTPALGRSRLEPASQPDPVPALHQLQMPTAGTRRIICTSRKSAKFAARREPAHTRLRWCRAIFFPSSCGSSAMTTRPDLAADRRIEVGGYTVRRPRRGPSDDEVRMLINMQQEGEIAFQLHSLAQLQFTAGSALLESRTYEA